MYISPIQHGIQTAHCIAEMFVKYSSFKSKTQIDAVYEWATGHKTVFILNGGTGEDLREALSVIYGGEQPNGNSYPHAAFQEPSIDNALTCIGVILPENFNWTLPPLYPEIRRFEDLTYEQRVAALLSSKHLAR